MPSEAMSISVVEKSYTCYPKDKVLFVQRDEADKLFIIKEGVVKISIFTDQGEERIIEFLNAGRFLGAPDIFAGNTYGITATAFTNVLVATYTAKEVEKLLGTDQEFSIKLAKSISEHARALGKQLVGESFYSAIGQVGYSLQNLAIQIGTSVGDGGRFVLPITQTELAQYIGCNRITVTKALAKMVEEGLIEKKKKNIFIKDIKRLTKWLNEINTI